MKAKMEEAAAKEQRGKRGRERQFAQQVHLRLTTLDRSLISYYEQRYEKSYEEIVRGCLWKYVEGDTGFDPDNYLRVVERGLVAEFEDEDEVLQEKLREVSQEYAAKRRGTAKPKTRKIG